MIILYTEALAFPWGGLTEKIFTDIDGIFAGLGGIDSERESGGSHRLATSIDAFPPRSSISAQMLVVPQQLRETLRGGVIKY